MNVLWYALLILAHQCEVTLVLDRRNCEGFRKETFILRKRMYTAWLLEYNYYLLKSRKRFYSNNLIQLNSINERLRHPSIVGLNNMAYIILTRVRVLLSNLFGHPLISDTWWQLIKLLPWFTVFRHMELIFTTFWFRKWNLFFYLN